MSFFCRLNAEDIKELKQYESRFEKGIKKLNLEEKDKLLMNMFKTRHNLLVDLTETKNKNTLLFTLMLCCVALTVFIVSH